MKLFWVNTTVYFDQIFLVYNFVRLRGSLRHRFCEKMELNELVRPFARLCTYVLMMSHNNFIAIHNIHLLQKIQLISNFFLLYHHRYLKAWSLKSLNEIRYLCTFWTQTESSVSLHVYDVVMTKKWGHSRASLQSRCMRNALPAFFHRAK